MHTLLSDIAAKCMPFQENIVLVQVDLLSKLMSECIASKDQKYNSDAEKRYTLCIRTLPILIGLARSMGRFCADGQPLLCRLFPRLVAPTVEFSDTSLGKNMDKNYVPFQSRREPSLHRELGVGYVLTTTKIANLELPLVNLQNIFTLVKQLLAKDTLEFLDQQVDALFDSGEIQDFGVFPYKTFSETLTLTMATMLKELLHHNKRK
ncbi:unnamed protein product [Timema podura]|uniref:Uncharacterized protein n=1 Tax=Timema podura TaxID=61482 RepID=A0ABN7NZM2_TIMPD|nr:unnamed protein product [Timema podura]